MDFVIYVKLNICVINAEVVTKLLFHTLLDFCGYDIINKIAFTKRGDDI